MGYRVALVLAAAMLAGCGGGGGSSASAPAPAVPPATPELDPELSPVERFNAAAERLMSYAGGNVVRNGIQIFQNANGLIEAQGEGNLRWNADTRQFAVEDPASFPRRPARHLRGRWNGVALAKFSSEHGVTQHVGDVTLVYDGSRPDTTTIDIVMDAPPMDVAYRTIAARMDVNETGGYFHAFESNGYNLGQVSGSFGGTEGRFAGGRFRYEFIVDTARREWDGGFSAEYQQYQPEN